VISSVSLLIGVLIVVTIDSAKNHIPKWQGEEETLRVVRDLMRFTLA
jgi:hypothetical protein